ncbi:hypothetical protein HPT25_27375 [Bacillus sp. BRMEA1]|uniref:Rad52/Rad22 family DNA repair protein n=1 Tax=Neobacillus endophyticus TaxID=2738405 RepID=UPI0015665979|nr:Rad52/Rad22 family DNA repair protein [Neobacillus endophyticus]NRD81043.1 hypothetical protein [Neobacillus endophyticus]
MTNCSGVELSQKELMERLQEPFAPEDIEWRVQRSMMVIGKPKAIVLGYVTARAIQQRLDDVVGPLHWKNSYSTWRENGVLCGIAIKYQGEWIEKFDGADETNVESTKGGFSASFKRTAAAGFGIGRYLYKLEESWVEINESKKTPNDQYFNAKVKNGNQDTWIKGYWTPPTLPDWALPKGYSTGTQTAKESNQEKNQSKQQQQTGQNRTQSSNREPKKLTRDDMLKTIKDHEKNLGLPDKLRFPLFLKANPGSGTSKISNATEEELKRYFWAIHPVSLVVTFGKNYGLSMDELLYYCQIVKPEEKISELFNLFLKLTREDVQNILNLIRGDKQEQTA